MKILVAGDVEGRFKQLFSRVQNVIKKSGQFEMLLCVGTTFTSLPECREQWTEYVEGRETVPIATFVLGPSSAEDAPFFEGVGPDGGELCPNMTCLGQRGVYTTSSGLQIAYLSGRSYDGREYGKSGEDGRLCPHFTVQDVQRMESYREREGFVGVDILLTSEWPKGVENHTTPPDSLDMRCVGAEAISQLAASLKPRYHFVGKHHVFYERTPYRNHQVLKGTPQHVTRFIALAHVGNPDKKRYLYAFSISPLSSMDPKELAQQPPAITDFPYSDIVRAKAALREDLSEQNFFFDPRALAAGTKRKQKRESGTPQAKRTPLLSQSPSSTSAPSHPPTRPPAPRGPCWFCLGSPEVEKHLIVAIGDNSYLALPKGGLVREHVLILPIGHYAASTEAPQEVLEELGKFRNSLKKYFHSKKQSCVIFERNFRSQHLQLQVIPIPKTPSEALKQAFIDHGKSQGVEFTEVPEETALSELVRPGAPYFTVEFDDGPSLFFRIKGRFPLQFGREVLASPLILNMPSRVDWKACSATKEEETSAAETMRQNFQPFNFTDDSDD